MAEIIVNQPGSTQLNIPAKLSVGDKLIFNYTNNSNLNWTVPCDGEYAISAYGAKGGSTNGGQGGFASATVFLRKGQVLNFRICSQGVSGGGGGAAGYIGSQTAEAGYPGGGGTIVKVDGKILLAAGGGGGAGGAGRGGSVDISSRGYGGMGGDNSGQSGGAGGRGENSIYYIIGGSGGTAPSGGGRGGGGLDREEANGSPGADGPTVYDGGGGGGGGYARYTNSFGSGGGGGAGGRNYFNTVDFALSNMKSYLGNGYGDGRVEILVGSLKDGLYLIQTPDSSIKTIQNGQLVDTELVYPLTQDDFQSLAFTSFDGISLDTLPQSFTLLYWSENYADTRKAATTVRPQDQIVLANDDINLSHVETIKQFAVQSDVPENEYLGVIFSNDSGQSWYGWDQQAADFILINDINDLEEVRTASVTSDVISTIPSEKWHEFIFADEPEIIRFGYYMTPGVANDNLSMTVDLKGQYKSVCNRVDYDWEFSSNDLITLNWYGGEGTIKINYVDGK